MKDKLIKIGLSAVSILCTVSLILSFCVLVII